MTSRLLLGVVAKEPVYAPELRPRSTIADSLICARCDGQMVISYDALQRPRKRCPKCDGVARARPVHPDQVLVPVTLAKLTPDALPHVEAGQLRCQRCAKGVEGKARFHPECLAAISLERRQRRCACGAVFVPTAGAKRCATCRTNKRVAAPRLCTGCNRLLPAARGLRIVSSCSQCRVRPPKTRTCTGCGRQRPRTTGPSVVRSCAECRRSGPTTARVYSTKICRRCENGYTPTGPRQRYCGACRATSSRPHSEVV